MKSLHDTHHEAIIVLLSDRLKESALQSLVLPGSFNDSTCAIDPRISLRKTIAGQLTSPHDVVNDDAGSRRTHGHCFVEVGQVILFVCVDEDEAELLPLPCFNLLAQLGKDLL